MKNCINILLRPQGRRYFLGHSLLYETNHKALQNNPRMVWCKNTCDYASGKLPIQAPHRGECTCKSIK